MASLNKVFLIGNLTRMPELRYTPSGTAVTDLRLAVNRNYTTQSGEKREDTCFLTVVVWGKQAETCREYLDKGSPVLIEGRLQTRDWEAKDGQFECPKHHSKYRPDGTFIEGRATRGLDRFSVRMDGNNVIVNLDKLFEEKKDAGWDAAYVSP